MPTKAELEVRITDLELHIEDLVAEREVLRGENNKWKRKITKKAMTLAAEHDWCREVYVSLKKLGMGEHIPDHWEYDWIYRSSMPEPRGGCFWTKADAVSYVKDTLEENDQVRLWRVPGKGKAVLDPFEW